MGNTIDFNEAVKAIVKKKPNYPEAAYHFVREALSAATRAKFKEETRNCHLSCRELAEGLRAFALAQYGPMAMTVLNSWNIYNTLDFGEIVFNLIDNRVFTKSEQDSKNDFANVYDFKEAFVNPFLPPSALHSPAPSKQAVSAHN